MENKILDNNDYGKMGEALAKAIDEGCELSIVSAYFTIGAYIHLKDKLNTIKHLRFLFGEPNFVKIADPLKLSNRQFSIQDNALDVTVLRQLSQRNDALECAKWLDDKAEIRSMVKPNFLHGKMYCIQYSSDRTPPSVFVGSSNFTVSGLGLGRTKNIELNYVVKDTDHRGEFKEWFDSIWNRSDGLVEDVKDRVLNYLWQLYAEHSPEFIYRKTVAHILSREFEPEGNLTSEQIGMALGASRIWNMLYEFQRDGVVSALNRINRHGGCIIADSVGLGKTFEALAIIRFYQLKNKSVLVICPKKLRGNWAIYQDANKSQFNPLKEDRFNFTLLNHTDMCRESGESGGIKLNSFNWSAFDLVVIDESHNFRGDPVVDDDEDAGKSLNRAGWLMERILKAGNQTKVLMLSATPVNNSLRDLGNQIALITRGRNDAFMDLYNIRNIAGTLKQAQSCFLGWTEMTPDKRNPDELMQKLDVSFTTLLSATTVARSRKQIVDAYGDKVKFDFPARNKPKSLSTEIDMEGEFPSFKRVWEDIGRYKLVVYNPSGYLKDEVRSKYESAMRGGRNLNFSQETRERFLIGMMRTNYLKRLESSIHSFTTSIGRTVDKIDAVMKQIKTFQAKPMTAGDPAIVAESELYSGDQDMFDPDSEWEVGSKLSIPLFDLRLDDWLADLKDDKNAMKKLLNDAREVDAARDAKLQKLKELILAKMDNPINPGNRKVLVFTAFIDTARYLYDHLNEWIRTERGAHSALVTGDVDNTLTTFGVRQYDDILTNFSPRSKNRELLIGNGLIEEIDLLIATDCISEGQNLQDCDYLVNYDIHWNPVRLIQRFGRIDRLGSKNAVVQMVNFWPTPKLDDYLKLKGRVESRMALVDMTATGDDNPLDETLQFNLRKIEQENLDEEDVSNGLSMSCFNIDQFKADWFDKEYAALLKEPLGLHAIVPAPGGDMAEQSSDREFTDDQKSTYQPGVIWVLRKIGENKDNDAVNAINPYFLAYVLNDGTVRLNYTNPQAILTMMEKLCKGRTLPYEELCKLFNAETSEPTGLERYADLLRNAVVNITEAYQNKSLSRLTQNRSAKIAPTDSQIKGLEDFELITWLIVK